MLWARIENYRKLVEFSAFSPLINGFTLWINPQLQAFEAGYIRTYA
jgi:hypothetical protein